MEVLNKPPQQVKGPYVLEAQSVTISLSGSLAEVKEFLRLLNAENKLLMCRRLSLKPVPEGSQVMFELELLLLELTYAPPSVA